MTITADLLEKALLAAADSCAPGELAYLALTSKPELAIRDRLAWVLHRRLSGHRIPLGAHLYDGVPRRRPHTFEIMTLLPFLSRNAMTSTA
ncbi:hypothetical protein ACFRJ3_45880 [Streptomyces sp. NPDC056696]|uniref:hypothetical protein n=1 Tax=Streptomyces sp. NPDC056696 TaxID=3345914 RepID=UPI0036B9CD59